MVELDKLDEINGLVARRKKITKINNSAKSLVVTPNRHLDWELVDKLANLLFTVGKKHDLDQVKKLMIKITECEVEDINARLTELDVSVPGAVNGDSFKDPSQDTVSNANSVPDAREAVRAVALLIDKGYSIDNIKMFYAICKENKENT